MTLEEHMQKNESVFLDSNHRWMRNSDGDIDWFASVGGFHNGPMCEDCGYSRCVHCNGGDPIPDCSRPTPTGTGGTAKEGMQ